MDMRVQDCRIQRSDGSHITWSPDARTPPARLRDAPYLDPSEDRFSPERCRIPARDGCRIDALEVMALDPHALLVTPRVLGILAVLPALTMLALLTVLGSAWGVAVLQLGQNGQVFWSYVQTTASLADFGLGAVKAVLFGIVICLVSCYAGFTSAPGPEGVGRATNVAVVVSAVACVILNFLVSVLAYG